jgi:hypothetical protein
MGLYLVEHEFDPPLPAGAINPDSKVSPCVKTHEITWVSSFLARDGSRCLCVYEAADAEAVRRAYRSAEVAFRAVWPASRLQP